MFYNASGCQKDVALNRVTFLPLRSDILYFSSSHGEWNSDILDLYKDQYRVVNLDLERSDIQALCGKSECLFYDIRYEKDRMNWIFLYIGNVMISDAIVSMLHYAWIVEEYSRL